MPLSVGDKLGPYEILASIGKGGMGEVYRARDPRLNRDVAIKVSAGQFSERFEREAKAIAALNHPNICQIYDVGPNYLVMEYVEGWPLKGPLPLDQTLKYAAQICDALDAAHRKKIAHRDLKPANILVTKAGVKLLDFGLAKMGPAVKADEATMTMALTGKGEILGTLLYMSPEQVNGEEAGPPSDIFSFGLVLYEMLTGKRVFDGKSQASVIAAILERPAPSVSDVAPVALDRALKRCLEKDPENRWQTARDLKAELEWINSAPEPGRTASSPSRLGKLTAIAVAAFAVIAAVTVWALWPKPPAPVKSTRFQIPPPENENFTRYMAFSPDGRKLAFTTTGPRSGVWVRDLDALESRHLAGTEGAGTLFWSPDSRFIAFGVGSQLKKIEVSGGPPQTLCEAGGPVAGGGWNRDGVIVFGGFGQGPVRRVSASGGVPTEITTVDRQRGETNHTAVNFLPDGRHFLYFRGGTPEVSGIYAGSLDAKPEEQKRERLFATRGGAFYTPSQDPAGGRVFFMRENTLMTQTFDAGRLALTGEPVPVAEQVGIEGFRGFFSVSPSGALAYRTGTPAAGFQLTWFDRQGRTQGTFGELSQDRGIALSADGTRAAVRDAFVNVRGDIWTLDFARGVRTRFTFRQTAGPFVWSPDGSRIAFAAGNVLDTLYEKASSGAGDEKELFKKPGEIKNPTSWSRDGRFLLYSTFSVPKTQQDLWVLPLEGDRKPVLLLGTEFQEREGNFSPDMRWTAYTSTESGRPEVYVRPFLASGSSGAPSLGEGKWQVSKDGGELAKWRADGKELIFRAPNGSPMAVDVNVAGAAFQVGVPKQLFALRPNVGDWDVTADGKRFIVGVPPAQQNVQTPITVVLNWEAAMKR